MSRDENEKIEGHSYDGIEELDNRLPNWWLNMFYLSIVFSGLYVAWYSLGPGKSISENYAQWQQSQELAQLAQKAADKPPSEEELLAVYKDPENRKKGQAVFQSKCVSCHGPQGGGGIGPNLTDDYWLHGGKLAEIAHTVTTGVPDKGMPPWGPVLSKDEIRQVVSFIHSIRGSNPPNAKAPQGVIAKYE